MDVETVHLKAVPVTLHVEVKGTGKKPYSICIKEGKEIWYYRELQGKKAMINLPLHPDSVKIRVSLGVIVSVMVAPLKFPKIPYLEEPETARPYPFDALKIRHNLDMKTPARMFTRVPIIEINPNKMAKYWVPVREFIMWHEIAHRFFDDERKADTWATITFLNRGWNLSTAIYALTRILGESGENVKRMLFQNELLKALSKRYYG